MSENNNRRKYLQKKVKLPVDYGDQLAPQDIELEMVVLGSVIIEANTIDKIMGDFNVNLFYLDNHKTIANAIIELYAERKPIDLVTLAKHLQQTGKLKEVGGAVYISQLTNRVGGTGNIEYHVRLLQQEALRRSIIQIGSINVRKAFDTTEDIFDVYQQLQIDIDNALKEVLHYSVKSVGDIHQDVLKETYNVIQKGHKSGITSGLKMVDNLTNGWQKTDLIILAGRPSMGKTAAAVSLIMHPAMIEKEPVAIFSLEMSAPQLVGRMQSNISGVNVSKIVKKQLTIEEFDEITISCVDLQQAPIYIDDTPNISLLELKGKARKLVKEQGVKLIVIDYLQLMRSGMQISNREQEIAEISRGLKGLAKELDIPVIALSQLSRSVEARGGDKKPMLSDLRESGQIEQDADMVIFCYRPEYYGIENYEVGGQEFETHGLFMLLIAKHRNGELGEIPLKFVHEQTKLKNYDFNFPNNNNSSTFVKQEQVNTNALMNNNTFDNKIGTGGDDAPF